MSESECKMECKTECKPECIRDELKKLSPEERVHLLREIHIEEVNAEEEKLKADPMFPIKSSMANMAREIENLKKQVERLKYERQIISQIDTNINDTENDCCDSFSWWPIIIFFLFIIITSSIGGGSMGRCPVMPKFHMD